MPTQAPRFRPKGWAERPAWASTSRRATKRLRGRAGQKARAEVLAAEPFCRECAKHGRERKADVVDHIVPLAWGGAEARSNRQPLCNDCHEVKSAGERVIGKAKSS